MKILFLVPYPSGEAPSQRFRFEQYFELLTRNNIHYSVSTFWMKRAWTILYKPGYYFEKLWWLALGFFLRSIHLIQCLSYDIIFIHRECTPVGPPIFEFIISRLFRKKIIYDFDDAIWLPNTSVENKLVRWIKFHNKVKPICTWSYRVSCGNDWLAGYARNFNSNVVVNPTTIDTDLHHPGAKNQTQEKKKLVIGWTGTHSTLFYLNNIVVILKQVEKKYPVKIQIISNKEPNLDLDFEYVPWNKEKEIEQLRQFDIGIMPLADDEWAKGKCGFKALQYMALEIPCIASPVGVNTKIITHNYNGLLCATDKEWLDAFDVLIRDKTKRKNLGIAARKKVIDHYSVSSNSTNFLSLIRL